MAAENSLILTRSAVPDDAEELAAIMREVGWFEWVHTEQPHESVQRIRQRLIEFYQDDDHHTILIAEKDGVGVIGFVNVEWMNMLTANEGYISHLFIHMAARGQGIGARLLNTVIDEAKKRQCRRLFLYIRRSRDAYQRRFYHKAGWEEQDAALFSIPVR